MGIKRNGARGFVGEQRIFAGSLPAFGWLECDGGLYDGAAYPALYAEIGTAYNVGGEAAGFFRVPDKRGRGSIGRGQGAGLTARTHGQRIGAEAVALVETEMPIHNHNIRTRTGGTGDSGYVQRMGNGSSTQTDTLVAQNSGGGAMHSNMAPVEVDIWGIKF